MENPYTHGTIHIQYKYNTYTYKQNTKKQNESDDIDMLPSFDTEYPEPQYKVYYIYPCTIHTHTHIYIYTNTHIYNTYL